MGNHGHEFDCLALGYNGVREAVQILATEDDSITAPTPGREDLEKHGGETRKAQLNEKAMGCSEADEVAGFIEEFDNAVDKL